MSTRQKNDRRDRNDYTEDSAESRRRPRWGRRIGILLLLLLVVIFFLPMILLQTSLKQKAIDWATADLNGNLKVESASAGWFSSVKLSGVQLTDEAGQTVASIDEITVDKTLLNLATGSDYGTVRIVRPALDFQIRNDGSNLEDVLANYLAESAESETAATSEPMKLPKVKLEVVEGLVQVQSPTDPVWVFDGLNANVDLASDTAPALIALQCNAKSNGTEPGKINLKAVIDEGASELAFGQIASTLHTEHFPVGSLSPVLKRFAGSIQCVGQMDGQLDLAADVVNSTIAVDVNQFNLKNFVVAAPEYLKGDRFAARNLSARGRLNLSPQEIFAEKFETVSEFARFNADGQFNVNQILGMMNQGELPTANFLMEGEVDLAQVLAMLPETTGMRDDVRVNSGLVTVSANTRNENGSPRMVFNLETANINATRNGQAIVWQKPLRVAGAVVQQRGGQMALENVACTSEFLTLTGQATIQKGNFELDGDLAKVTQQFGQLIDLGEMELAGTLEGDFGWTMAQAPEGTSPLTLTNRPIQIEGDFVVANPVVQLPGMNRWSEKRLDVTLKALGRSDAEGQVGIDQGWTQCKFGTETATANLNQPIANIITNDTWQFACNVTGEISNWLAQTRNFVELPEFIAKGDMQSQFLFTMTPQNIRINQLKLDATNLDFDGFSMSMREPKVNANGNLTYDLTTGRIDVGNVALTSSAIAAGGENLVVNIGDKILVDGNVAFRANANRASQWFGFSLPADSVQWNGDAEGNMAFTSEQNAFGGELSTTVKQLVFYQKAEPNQAGAQGAFSELWREENVVAKSKVFLADDFNSVRLGGLQMNSKMADVQGHGTIGELATTVQANLKGQWNLNWDEITKLVQASAGDTVQFTGGQWQPFEVTGPLIPSADQAQPYVDQKLSAKTAISWQSANVMQMPLGPNTIEIDLFDAIAGMKSQSQESVVGQVFAMQPAIDLRSANPTLNVNQGTVLNNWQITESDSRTWLKYFAPMMADATSVQGQISVMSEGARVPLFDPMKVSTQGNIELGELIVGAGPLTQQLLPVLDQIKNILKPGSSSIQSSATWLKIKPQNVRYAVQDGRVYHDNMEFNYKDIPLRTRGNVGFDQTMNMVAEIPILDKWLEEQPYLAGLKGQSLQIPIGGTLTKPRLDRNAIKQLTQQLIQQTARGAVDGVVNKEVDKLRSKATEKLGGEFNKLQDRFGSKIQESLGGNIGGLLGGNTQQGNSQTVPGANLQEKVGEKLENELRNGLNNLFKNKNR